MAESLTKFKAQHFTTCQTCNRNVKFFCKPCNAKLCLECVTPHLETNAPDHNIIYYHKKVKTLMDAELVGKIPCGYIAMISISYAGNDQFYVSSHGSKTVKLVSREGVIVNVFKTSTMAYRFAAIEDGLLFPKDKGIIRKINNCKEELIITTEPATVICLTFVKPFRIYACLSEEHGEENKVVKYNTNGTTLLEVQYENYKPLYAFPQSIAVNGNGDICVCDFGSTQKHIKPAVTVVDKYGHFRFSYTADHQECFNPSDLCTNSCFHLIVIEYNNNNNIHVIDKDGTFLRYLNFNQDDPACICTDDHDRLFVCNMFDSFISVINYLS
ncbi:uncharacterized protein LOC143056147 [Mytilus galloprovincialis]|uniref:uncharacterized protein LOC143056147 n=1 Tax=Mytilus galloprovincialis TaxID=29158 RepID=UPI003F7C56DE